MKKVLLKIFLFTLGFLSIESYSQNLENHKWNNRVLIVKTKNINSEIYLNQLKEFQNSKDQLKERKLIIYKINNDEFSSINYITNKTIYGKVSKKISKKILNENQNFELVLIGLDGNIKLKRNEILTKEALFSIIDAMPMRKYNLKQ
jgi:hypothetical protein